jgi:hypothetical protein
VGKSFSCKTVGRGRERYEKQFIERREGRERTMLTKDS